MPNRYLDSKWRAMMHEKHMQKLRDMKPCLRIKKPNSLKIKRAGTRAKRRQIMEGKGVIQIDITKSTLRTGSCCRR